MTEAVEINECFARDGLQHEEGFIATKDKLELLDLFVETGFKRIEATSYSHPKYVPAFADASELLKNLDRTEGVYFKATCPNERAVQRALADYDAGYGAEEISLLTSASESHTAKNLRTTKAGQWDRVREMIRMADGKFRLVGVVSVAFGCPFEGKISTETVLRDIEYFRELDVDVITIGDTTGLADPYTVRNLFERLTQDDSNFPYVAHFHDTRGSGIANAFAAFEAGCRRFDSSMGGVGGHPSQITYGSGMTGNVATEDLVNMFDAMGVATNLDLETLNRASQRSEELLQRELHSKVARAGFSRELLSK